MAGLFSSPSVPAQPQAAPPSVADPSVQAAAAAQRAQMAQAAGRASTIFTSGQGDTSTPVIGRKTLLGQ